MFPSKETMEPTYSAKLFGVLVSKLPETCEHCPFEVWSRTDDDKRAYQCIPGQTETTEIRTEKRLDACPLKLKEEYDDELVKLTLLALAVHQHINN